MINVNVHGDWVLTDEVTNTHKPGSHNFPFPLAYGGRILPPFIIRSGTGTPMAGERQTKKESQENIFMTGANDYSLLFHPSRLMPYS